MTTEDKIEVLEKAMPLIGKDDGLLPYHGICAAIGLNLPDYNAHDKALFYNENAVDLFLQDCQIKLPNNYYCFPFSWPLNSQGKKQRKEFLRTHIARLKSELKP